MTEPQYQVLTEELLKNCEILRQRIHASQKKGLRDSTYRFKCLVEVSTPHEIADDSEEIGKFMARIEEYRKKQIYEE